METADTWVLSTKRLGDQKTSGAMKHPRTQLGGGKTHRGGKRTLHVHRFPRSPRLYLIYNRQWPRPLHVSHPSALCNAHGPLPLCLRLAQLSHHKQHRPDKMRCYHG